MLKLRALEPEDLEFFYEIENEEEDWKQGCTTVPVSRYALRQYIAESKIDIFLDGQVRLAAEFDGRLVGLVDLNYFNPQHRRAEVGIIIHKDYRGKHLGQEALSELVRYARSHLGLYQLYAIVSAKNTPAQRLFSSEGFVRTGCLKDWLLNYEGKICDAFVFQCLL